MREAHAGNAPAAITAAVAPRKVLLGTGIVMDQSVRSMGWESLLERLEHRRTRMNGCGVEQWNR